MKKEQKQKMKNQSKKVTKFVYWTPRILSILFLCFLALFSLDIFGNNYTFWETIVALFMHNIPVIALALLLWVSWKYEIVGAITFILAGLFYVFLLVFRQPVEWYIALTWSLTIAGPAFIIGILFLINWKRKKK